MYPLKSSRHTVRERWKAPSIANGFDYPKEKDYVDTQLVLEWILEKGADEITFLGATGGRLDLSGKYIY